MLGFNCPCLLPASDHPSGGICISFANHHSYSEVVVAVVDFGSLECKAFDEPNRLDSCKANTLFYW